MMASVLGMGALRRERRRLIACLEALYGKLCQGWDLIGFVGVFIAYEDVSQRDDGGGLRNDLPMPFAAQNLELQGGLF